ncbi:hypothetical protein [Nocardia asteroides]
MQYETCTCTAELPQINVEDLALTGRSVLVKPTKPRTHRRRRAAHHEDVVKCCPVSALKSSGTSSSGRNLRRDNMFDRR